LRGQQHGTAASEIDTLHPADAGRSVEAGERESGRGVLLVGEGANEAGSAAAQPSLAALESTAPAGTNDAL
jgi:hypothetical protein